MDLDFFSGFLFNLSAHWIILYLVVKDRHPAIFMTRPFIDIVWMHI
jgi:hypothetical protein